MIYLQVMYVTEGVILMSVLGVIVFLAVGSILISLLITLITYIGKVYMKKYNKKFVP